MPPAPPAAPRRPQPTHFLCIPLVTRSSRPQLQRALQRFRDAAVAAPGGEGGSSSSSRSSDSDAAGSAGVCVGVVPPSAIRPLGTLHLTLGVMNLGREESVRDALGALRAMDWEALLAAPAVAGFGSRPREGKEEAEGKGADGEEKREVEAVGSAALSSSSERQMMKFPAARPGAAGPKELPSPPPRPASRPLAARTPASAPSPSATAVPISSPTPFSQPPASSPSAAAAAAAAAPPPPAQPLIITLRGLHSMHPPARTSVLYASPDDPSGRLHAFCAALHQRFARAGFLLPDPPGRRQQLLLHATIVNTIYARRGADSSRGSQGRGRGRSGTGAGAKGRRFTIDATALLPRFAEHVWMRDVRLETVALCRMGAKKGPDGDEMYEVEGEVSLPYDCGT
ncbi:MAG: hypothetical protein M1818_006335 [Claussenomyces sp. TS43310]|nr:MAG: hypothetical protein M1818_006335 [Claussenomyces sp. TS43310]